MSAGSEAVLYDIDGDPMAITNGTPIPSATSVLVGGGSDGTNAQFIKVDSSGNQIMIGLGTAGSPAGGVLTIQGAGSGTPVPISGTITANAGSGNFSVVQATAANLNATVIGTITANIGTSGALALDATLAKLTIAPGTAIGSNTLAMIGGHVTTGSPTYTDGNINPLSLTTAGALRIDGSGVIHPVSQSGTWTVQPGNTANTTPWLTTINQGGNSAIVTASNALKVDGSAVTQPVSGTVTANQGTSPWVSNITQFGSSNVVTGTGTSGSGIPRVTVSNDSNILATQSGTWTVQQGTPPWSVVGPAADGAAVSGNPVRVAGSDGTNTQDITTDTSGRLLVSGAAADGAAVTGNPVLMGGQDGTNAQSILTDTIGRLTVVGAAADGAAVAGNPLLIGGTDGTNAQTVELRNTHPVGGVQGVVVRNLETSFPTFHVVFDRISPAANKYMATLWNGASGRKVVVQRIWRFNWQVATVTGTTLDQELRRITARTVGTSVTPIALDSNDTLTSGITADHNSSSVTDSSLLQRVTAVSEERDGLDTRVVDWLALYPFALIYDRKDGTRGIVLRENQGLTIKNITSSTVGTVSYIIEFTDEVA